MIASPVGAWRGRRIEQQADHRGAGDQADQNQGGDAGDGPGGDRGRGEFVGPIRSGGRRDGRAGRGAGGGQPPGDDECAQRGQYGRRADFLRMSVARHRVDGAVSEAAVSGAGLADGRGARSPTRPPRGVEIHCCPRIVGSIAMGLLPAPNLRTKVFIFPSSRLLVFRVARESRVRVPSLPWGVRPSGARRCRNKSGAGCVVSAYRRFWHTGPSVRLRSADHPA